MFRQDRGWRIEQPRHALSVIGGHWFDGFRQLVSWTRPWSRPGPFPPRLSTARQDRRLRADHFGRSGSATPRAFQPVRRHRHGGHRRTGHPGVRLRHADPAQRRRHQGVDQPLRRPGKPESAFRSLGRLLDALGTAAPPSNSGRDNLKTIALLEAAYQSAEQGRAVELTGDCPREDRLLQAHAGRRRAAGAVRRVPVRRVRLQLKGNQYAEFVADPPGFAGRWGGDHALTSALITMAPWTRPGPMGWPGCGRSSPSPRPPARARGLLPRPPRDGVTPADLRSYARHLVRGGREAAEQGVALSLHHHYQQPVMHYEDFGVFFSAADHVGLPSTPRTWPSPASPTFPG